MNGLTSPSQPPQGQCCYEVIPWSRDLSTPFSGLLKSEVTYEKAGTWFMLLCEGIPFLALGQVALHSISSERVDTSLFTVFR